MNTIPTLLAMTGVLLLSPGCVSHTTCVLYNGPSGNQLQIHQAQRGLIFGICGPTTHADSECIFYLPGNKDVYQGLEIQPKGINFGGPPRYDGSISFLRATEQVDVKLSEAGHPFELNGRIPLS
jgi:hypothetical protein